MKSFLILACIFLAAKSQAQYSYFNIHRDDVAPFPTFRPFNPSLHPLLLTPPSIGVTSGSDSTSSDKTETASPSSVPAGDTPASPGHPGLPQSFYYNSFEQGQTGAFNPFLSNGFPSLTPNQATPDSSPTPPAPSVPPHITNFFNQFYGGAGGFPYTNLNLPELNLTGVPELPQQVPAGFPFTNFNLPELNLTGIPELPHQVSTVQNTFVGGGFPFNGFNQLPSGTSYFRGPQGFYNVQGQQPFGHGFNPYPRLFPQPVVYQVIYYQLPNGNSTSKGNDTSEATPATTQSSVVIIPNSPIVRVTEELTKRPSTTTTTPTTTTTTTTTTRKPATTTTAKPTTTTKATTTSTENTTEK